MVEGELLDSRVRVREDWKEVYADLYYGKEVDGHLDLAPVEAMHLVERGELDVVDDGEAVGEDDLFDLFVDREDEFPEKYAAYRDLRERGYIVKSGFKFGAHFRVYPRGVNPYKEGPKEQSEHTKWVVHAVTADDDFTFTDVSRAVRLAQNIRATMLWAVVDAEQEVTYYRVDHMTP